MEWINCNMYKNLSIDNSLFYTDLDGTLLNGQARVSAKSKAILTSLLNQGLQLGVASARNLNTISSMFDGMPISLPVISLNGGFISSISPMTHYQINHIEPDICNQLFSISDKFNAGFFLSTTDNISDGISHYNVKNDGEIWYLNDRLNCVGQKINEFKYEMLTDDLDLMCFTFIDRLEVLHELRSVIEHNCGNKVEIHLFENQYSPTWYWLTVHDFRATKDRALKYVRQKLNIENRNLVVFGDGVNDLKMFEVADVSIAVENSSEEVRSKADLVIGTNEADSVAKYLHDLIK